MEPTSACPIRFQLQEQFTFSAKVRQKKESALLDLHKMFTCELQIPPVCLILLQQDTQDLSASHKCSGEGLNERFGLADKYIYLSTKEEKAKGNPNGFGLVLSLVKRDKSYRNAALEKLDKRYFPSTWDHSCMFLRVKIFPSFSPAILSGLDLSSQPPTNLLL